MQTFKDLRALWRLLFSQPVQISAVDPVQTAVNVLYERQTNLRWAIAAAYSTERAQALANELMEVNKSILYLRSLREEEAVPF